MRLCVNSKAMQVKVQREKESCNGTMKENCNKPPLQGFFIIIGVFFNITTTTQLWPPFYRGLYILLYDDGGRRQGVRGGDNNNRAWDADASRAPGMFFCFDCYYSTNIYLEVGYTTTMMKLVPMPTPTPSLLLPLTTLLSHKPTMNRSAHEKGPKQCFIIVWALVTFL